VRPDVVWFEEQLPRAALARAYDISETADVMLVVGTSGVVQPAASLPFLAYQRGAAIIDVNPERTPITSIARWHLAGPSGVLLPQVLAALSQESPDA
jgi:NAD-dependent deacetylase